MRICVCGKHRDDVVKMEEKKYGVESINVNYPGIEDDNEQFMFYAAETFKYFNKKDVIFDGGVFDYFKFYSDQGWMDLQEQIILSVISNLDSIIIVTNDIDEKKLVFCKSFAELYPNKFTFIENNNV